MTTNSLIGEIGQLVSGNLKATLSAVSAARAVNLKHEEYIKIIDAVRFGIDRRVYSNVGLLLRESLEDPNVG